jgi:hypothetical protein
MEHQMRTSMFAEWSSASSTDHSSAVNAIVVVKGLVFICDFNHGSPRIKNAFPNGNAGCSTSFLLSPCGDVSRLSGWAAAQRPSIGIAEGDSR